VSDEQKPPAGEAKAGADVPKVKAHHHRAKHATKKGKKEGSMATKIVATVFGAVVAPILVAVGIKWGVGLLQPATPSTKEKDPQVKQEAPQPPPPPLNNTLSLVTPDLSKHFYTFNWNPDLERDERKDVIAPTLFRYEEKPSRIVVPGGQRQALMITKEEFEDYTLHFWYRWGEKTYRLGEGKARRAAILLHITGPDGAFNGIWPQCIVVNFGEGQTGSFRLMGTPGRIQGVAKVKESPDRLRRTFIGGDGEGIPQSSSVPAKWDRVINNLGFPDDMERDDRGFLVGVSTGYRPEGDPTHKPPLEPGFWNRVVIDCTRDAIRVTVNRTLVNEITGLNLRKGRIGIASQWAEYDVHQVNVELHQTDKPAEKPADKAPDKAPAKGRP
jgi:hypothetical protein